MESLVSQSLCPRISTQGVGVMLCSWCLSTRKLSRQDSTGFFSGLFFFFGNLGDLVGMFTTQTCLECCWIWVGDRNHVFFGQRMIRHPHFTVFQGDNKRIEENIIWEGDFVRNIEVEWNHLWRASRGLRNPYKNTRKVVKNSCIYMHMQIYVYIIYMLYIQHMLIFFSCPLGHWVTGTLCWNEAKRLFSNDSWNQSFLKLGMDHLVPLVNRRTAPKEPVKIPLARPTMMPSSDVVVRETPAQLVLSRLGFNSIPLGAETGTCE